MTRNVRDLHEMICVSRLSVNENNEISSDDETFEVQQTKESSAFEKDGTRKISTKLVNEISQNNNNFNSPSHSKQEFHLKGKVRTISQDKWLVQENSHHLTNSCSTEAAASKQLVQETTATGNENENRWSRDHSNFLLDSQENDNSSLVDSGAMYNNFDMVLCYMDATIVSEWLSCSSDGLASLVDFCQSEEKFVYFSQFWLAQLPGSSKQELFKMEFEILLKELELAFKVGREADQVEKKDIRRFLQAVFSEYPAKLLSSKGPQLFLKYLEILTSGGSAKYKTLLSQVACCTVHKQYAQWILATRSFALVNVWTAVVNFYKNLKRTCPLSTSVSTGSQASISIRRLLLSIRLGFVEVVHYLIRSGQIDPHWQDSQGRTLVFLSVIHNQPALLSYLLTRVFPPINVNLAAVSGNTALHAAVNQGSVKLVKCLLKMDMTMVDSKNEQCDLATPLHFAIVHGFCDIVEELLVAGADQMLLMGKQSTVQIARNFGHTHILKLLDSSDAGSD